ncbi:hypothetical protein O181_044894 [Austropuccinia psidii MF-1]|uniref:Uncharacterized protein n=1 Tax=Austropuccinia psidii MF-1 TaxID=1389203 RepID=A0A9Q3HJU9_9BASI|nr:hypothetical protein [Austropuccinia psidii MF-1]
MRNIEDMIRRFCAYGLECKDFDAFTHDWCTLISALELEYKKSIYYSTGKTPSMMEKGWNPRLTYETLERYFVDMNPTESSFKTILAKTDIMQTDLCKIFSNMQNKDGTKVTRHLILKWET